MKNRKGFTLIELLAIIVILAIIAVITVPIILNIIENSKRGAASDSAYGFKDAVNKAYVTKLSGDSEYEIPDDTYTVNDLKTQIDLSLSGKEPSSNSWVTIEKNNVTEGCLQYDEFKVELSDGKVTKTEKGECKKDLTMDDMCPDCVYRFSSTEKYIYNSTNSQRTDENSKLTTEEYTTDYTTINKDYFLGYVIDDNGYILKSYACGKEDNKYFCLESTSDGSKHNSNLRIMNEIFGTVNEYNVSLGSTVQASSSESGEVNVLLRGQQYFGATARGRDYDDSWCMCGWGSC